MRTKINAKKKNRISHDKWVFSAKKRHAKRVPSQCDHRWMSDCARQIKDKWNRDSNEKFMKDKTVFVPFLIHDGKYEMICKLWCRISHTGTHGEKQCWTKVKEENKMLKNGKFLRHREKFENWDANYITEHKCLLAPLVGRPRPACEDISDVLHRNGLLTEEKLRETLYFRNLFLFSLARLSDLVYDLRRDKLHESFPTALNQRP